jgi:iron uptake system component EfeO
VSRRELLAIVAAALLVGCGSETKSDASYQADIVSGTHALLLTQIQTLHQAALDLQAAAPVPVDRGWDATADQTEIDAMKTAWAEMRTSWEMSEGVLGALFPTIDSAIDGRYEDYLAQLGPAGDPDPFDGQGVTGMHAIERILYAPDIPSAVVTEEASLPGYQPAAWPSTAAQAAELKTGLCAELVHDTQALVDGWTPGAIDLPGVFDGIGALIADQQEKVSLAASHEEESRYSQRTLHDLRDNLTGSRTTFDLFVPWLQSKSGSAGVDETVQQAFDRIDSAYGAIQGDAVPAPPPTWNSAVPSVADQQTPFGKLYTSVLIEVDPNHVGSAVESMNRVADLLGLPRLAAQP